MPSGRGDFVGCICFKACWCICIHQCFWCLVPKVKFIYRQQQNYSPKIKGSVANSRLTNQTQVLYLCFANIYILTNLPCCKCWKNVSSSSHINFLSNCHLFFLSCTSFLFLFLFMANTNLKTNIILHEQRNYKVLMVDK